MRLLDNVDRKYLSRGVKATRRCMNCSKEIEDSAKGDIYTRRFCSDKCRTEYIGESTVY